MPQVNYGTPTDLVEILTAVRARICQATGIGQNLVFPTLLADEELVKTPPGNTFITIRPARFTLIKGITTGAGQAAFDGRIDCPLWTRLQTDQVMRDSNWLLNNGGVLSTWLKLLGGLHLFDPRRSSNQSSPDNANALLMEPMRHDTGFEFAARRPNGWGRLDSAWNLKFVHRLS